MAINIENAETQKLVEELAAITGETPTTAITEAVRERLVRVQQERQPRLADRLLAIGEDCARHLREPFRTVAHGDLLYDERGLPR